MAVVMYRYAFNIVTNHIRESAADGGVTVRSTSDGESILIRGPRDAATVSTPAPHI
jgi:hypothetical protein